MLRDPNAALSTKAALSKARETLGKIISCGPSIPWWPCSMLSCLAAQPRLGTPPDQLVWGCCPLTAEGAPMESCCCPAGGFLMLRPR